MSEDLKSLYDRLGGDKRIATIVDDFVTRAMADPRVNWERTGVTVGGFTMHRNKSMQWDANPGNVAQLKKHIVQFISLSTGGPAFYDGLEMKKAHTNMHITNAEFDAAVGDFKASLDKLQVPNKEQKELLAIIESTRPQIVEER
jgi:hemoglobin